MAADKDQSLNMKNQSRRGVCGVEGFAVKASHIGAVRPSPGNIALGRHVKETWHGLSPTPTPRNGGEYTLDAGENPKLPRVKERLSPFVLTTKWRNGRDQAIQTEISITRVYDLKENDAVVNSGMSAYAYEAAIRWLDTIRLGAYRKGWWMRSPG